MDEGATHESVVAQSASPAMELSPKAKAADNKVYKKENSLNDRVATMTKQLVSKTAVLGEEMASRTKAVGVEFVTRSEAMRETLRGTAAVVSGEIKGKTANLAGEMVSKTANIAGEMVSKTTQFKEALKTSLTSLGSRPQATSTKIDVDVAEDDCTESTDVLAPLQSPSKHRQARTSPRGNTYPSLWSDVDRFLPSDPPASDPRLETGDEEESDGTHSTRAILTPDQSEPSIAPDQLLIVPEMNGPDHPESVGVDSGGEGFVVPRLGHEEHGAGEGDEGKKGQGRGESRRAQEEEFSMNLWLMGSSNGGSSTTSSTAGWFPASSSQTQVTLAAPGCVLAPSWSISGFSNTQSQGGAAGKEREGRAGAEAEVGRGGSSGGEAEGGDDAAEGWHPTPPAVVQSPFGVSTRLEGPEPGQAEEGGDMDRVWEELYVQRECASQPSSPKESRGALPAIKRLLVVRRESVQRSDSRDSLASTDSRSSISRHATLGNDGWQQLDMAGGEGDVPRQRRRRRRRHSMDSIHLEAAGLKQRAASELAMHRSPPSPLSPSSQGPSLRAAEGAHAGWHGQPGVRSGRPIPVARPVPSPLQPPSPRLPAVRSSPLMSYEHPDLYSQSIQSPRSRLSPQSKQSPRSRQSPQSSNPPQWKQSPPLKQFPPSVQMPQPMQSPRSIQSPQPRQSSQPRQSPPSIQLPEPRDTSHSMRSLQSKHSPRSMQSPKPSQDPHSINSPQTRESPHSRKFTHSLSPPPEQQASLPRGSSGLTHAKPSSPKAASPRRVIGKCYGLPHTTSDLTNVSYYVSSDAAHAHPGSSASPPRRAAVPVHAPKLQQCMTGALPGHEGQEEEKACMRVLSGDGSCVSETGSMRIYHVPSKPMAPSSTAPDRSSLHQKQQKWQHRPALEVPPSPDGLSPHATGGRRLKSAPVSPSGHLVSPLASPAVASWDEPCRIDHRAFVRLYTDEGASSNRSNMWDISRECGGSERLGSFSDKRKRRAQNLKKLFPWWRAAPPAQ